MKDLLIIREYEFYGVKVLVKIDRRTKTASLVEYKDGFDKYDGKQWLFKDRELEYMNGWLNILRAMTAAVEEAKKELEAIKKEDEAAFQGKLISIYKVDEDES